MINEGRRLTNVPDPEPDEVRDALLGNDTDIDVETAEKILQSHGLSSDPLLEKMREMMQERIRNYHQTGTNEAEKENLQYFLRDMTNYNRARSPEAVKPEGWIKSIIDNTTAGLFPNHTKAQAYRGKDGDLTENDQNLIDSIEAELDDER
ncbi:MAG TPA: hypothetical protein PLK77_12805 [Pyrinomonadaceae bacterium]|nr:hypothetical protein [Pyrinomonadaceae bacterium]